MSIEAWNHTDRLSVYDPNRRTVEDAFGVDRSSYSHPTFENLAAWMEGAGKKASTAPTKIKVEAPPHLERPRTRRNTHKQ